MQTATAPGRPEGPVLEPGSYRDRGNRVFYVDGEVYRGLDAAAADQWRAVAATRFFRAFAADGRVVHTEETQSEEVRPICFEEGWSAVLRHERVPFVSYPYEWCFGMLRDAALLQLELLAAALKEDFILKDASAYNVQWRGTQPVFIDVPSLTHASPGEPWAGYRQFCQLFLFPLLLQAYKGVPFQSWLRGGLDGIPAAQLARLMSLRDWLRPGVLLDVVLQARLQARHGGAARDVRGELRLVGFNKGLIEANVARLRKIIGKLVWKQARSEWSDYELANSYSRETAEQKKAFVRAVVETRPWKQVWDLGCNTGTYSLIAARNAEYVLALDADPLTVEGLYQRLKDVGRKNVLPLMANLADASPDCGWRGRERTSLTQRGRPDLTLCLALIHHLVIGANLPLPEVVEWLAGLGGEAVIEFVTREDPMVRALLRHREDRFADYDQACFEHRLGRHFEIVRRQMLSSGTRSLYWARPKP